MNSNCIFQNYPLRNLKSFPFLFCHSSRRLPFSLSLSLSQSPLSSSAITAFVIVFAAFHSPSLSLFLSCLCHRLQSPPLSSSPATPPPPPPPSLSSSISSLSLDLEEHKPLKWSFRLVSAGIRPHQEVEGIRGEAKMEMDAALEGLKAAMQAVVEEYGRAAGVDGGGGGEGARAGAGGQVLGGGGEVSAADEEVGSAQRRLERERENDAHPVN